MFAREMVSQTYTLGYVAEESRSWVSVCLCCHNVLFESCLIKLIKTSHNRKKSLFSLLETTVTSMDRSTKMLFISVLLVFWVSTLVLFSHIIIGWKNRDGYYLIISHLWHLLWSTFPFSPSEWWLCWVNVWLKLNDWNRFSIMMSQYNDLNLPLPILVTTQWWEKKTEVESRLAHTCKRW